MEDLIDQLQVKDEYLRSVLMGHDRLVFDGAMGTMIQAASLGEQGSAPDVLSITHPAGITAIHRAYVEAGAQVITTNTFGANRLKLAGQAEVSEVYVAAADCARAAGARYVAGDIGPLGVLLDPYGDLELEEAEELFAEQAQAAADAGCDVLLIETMADLTEMTAAVQACRQNTRLPIFATMTFQENGHTYFGVTPEQAVEELTRLGVQVIGANCSVGPASMLSIIQRMATVSSVPLMAQPNAGLPRLEQGSTVYDVTPAEFRLAMSDILQAGATVAGSCCGTNPSFTAELSLLVQTLPRL